MRMISTLSQIRRNARVRLFKNDQSLVSNVSHDLYHRFAKKNWGSYPETDTAWNAAETFREEGYYSFEPQVEKPFIENLSQRVDASFETEKLSALYEGTQRLENSIETFPEIPSLVTKSVEKAIECYYGSFFKIYWVHIYRTLPLDVQPSSSFLWHVDNCPNTVVKLMVYLDDTTEATGAFRLKPRPISQRLINEGFWDRKNTEHLQPRLDDPSTTRVLEGKKGTSILFLNWGCVHKATFPEYGHRDVAVFFLIPSSQHWTEQLKKTQPALSRKDDSCALPFFV